MLDAGPCLNFLAVRQENVLIQLAAFYDLELAAPQRVNDEVEGMVKDPRFAKTRVLTTWRTLKGSGRAVYDQMTKFDDGLPQRPGHGRR